MAFNPELHGQLTAISEKHRLARLAAGDANAKFETNEIDICDIEEGGDGIVYAASCEEAALIRASVRRMM